MSQTNSDGQDGPIGSNEMTGLPDQSANPAMVRRRPASVTLRNNESVGPASDQANAALGDALRVVYRFLQFGMLVMVGFFLFSGLQKVEQNERGLRVSFGKVVADDLQPGFQLSLPRPLGEIVRIDAGNRSEEIRREFWPFGEDTLTMKDEQLAQRGNTQLDPTIDGMLLTGDLSIGHIQAKVEFARDAAQVAKFARNVHPDSERAMVSRAVMQSMIRAAASSTIDQLRQDVTLQERVLEGAQATLNTLESGLVIRSVSFDQRVVPFRLINVFNEVESAVANSNKAIASAQQERGRRLAEAAGEVSEDLLKLIAQYDGYLGTGKADQAEATLAKIDRILDGEAVGQDGVKVGGKLSGKAQEMLNEAQAQRSQIVNTARAGASLFAAKQAAFASNPGVVLVGDWTDAYTAFINRDTVQVFTLPKGTPWEIFLNRDPQLAREQDTRRLEQEQQKIAEDNAKQLKDAQLQNKSSQPSELGGP